MKRLCRICGKEFKPCRSWMPGDGNRWQDVACCEEHGAMFFAKLAKQKDEREERKVEDVDAESAEANKDYEFEGMTE